MEECNSACIVFRVHLWIQLDHMRKNVNGAQLDNMQVVTKLLRAHVVQKDSINLKKVKQRVCFVCRVGIHSNLVLHFA